MTTRPPRLPEGPAACHDHDPHLWFPATGEDPGPARRICHTCPLIAACQTYALAHDVHGVWGGTTYQQRRDLRRHLGIRAIPATIPARLFGRAA